MFHICMSEEHTTHYEFHTDQLIVYVGGELTATTRYCKPRPYSINYSRPRVARAPKAELGACGTGTCGQR